jgi:hypothetical protein
LHCTIAGFPAEQDDALRKPKIFARERGVVIAGEFCCLRFQPRLGSLPSFSVCGGDRKVQRGLHGRLEQARFPAARVDRAPAFALRIAVASSS